MVYIFRAPLGIAGIETRGCGPVAAFFCVHISQGQISQVYSQVSSNFIKVS